MTAVFATSSTIVPLLQSLPPTVPGGRGRESRTPLTRPNDFTNMPYAAKVFTELRGLDLYCGAGVRRALRSIDLADASGRSDGTSHVIRQFWLRPLGCASEPNV
jgi:hypothetical protein